MRTGVLSDSKVINLLNRQFVNTFVLLGDLPDLQNGTKGEPVSKLAQTIGTKLEASVAQGVGRSVNTFVLSPQLELIGHLPYRKKNQFNNKKEKYIIFLQDSLAGKQPGMGEESSEPASLNSDTVSRDLYVVLDDAQPSDEVLGVFRTPEYGHQDYTVVNINTLAFENGGMLTIEVSVGHAEAAGSFDLFDGGSELPTRGAPDGALTSAWGVQPGETQRITYAFERGQHFKLGATGDWFSEKGSVNAFRATISVESASEAKNGH